MKKSIVLFMLCLLALPIAAQTPVYDDLVIEFDSTASVYKQEKKKFVSIRSKRGTEGVNKVPKADSIVGSTITDIVLVYSEYSPDALAERETANRERWENLLMTYPEFFQFETNYKTICQCNANGDKEAFKNAAGFYIYYKTNADLKAEEAKAAKKEAEAVSTAKTEKTEEKKSSSKDVASTDKKEEKKEKKSRKEDKEDKEVKVVKEKKSDKEEKADNSNKENTSVAEAKVESKPKKEGFSKPKKAKDPKACRLPCYENGDDDLNAFFKDNIVLTKKQKRHSKDLVTVLRLQLNFDGTIKKVMLMGTNEELNEQVKAAVNKMNTWNAAVKGGITVKSEVKMTLKYDSDTKAMKPFETTITPRLGPKCTCVSDSEIFGE